jgi:ribosomal protein S18 acetylase RimI-like enzyme
MSDYLIHYGIKGMKWGVRKQKPHADYTVRSRDGDLIEMRRSKYGLLGKAIRRVSPKLAAEQDKTHIYDAYVNGKKVADLTLYKESDTSINVVWLGVKSNQRGKGYAQAILESSAGRAKAAGFKQMTLEVPGNSPDARHIYEKQGFVAGKQISSDDDVWGGLTKMKKKLRD